jgi:hypothetical protein
MRKCQQPKCQNAVARNCKSNVFCCQNTLWSQNGKSYFYPIRVKQHMHSKDSVNSRGQRILPNNNRIYLIDVIRLGYFWPRLWTQLYIKRTIFCSHVLQSWTIPIENGKVISADLCKKANKILHKAAMKTF